jgi:hypothetical protein
VALDNNYTTWDAFSNDSWPADYLIDATGQIRHVAIGEGDYGGNEALIRQLLTAANPAVALPAATDVADQTPRSQDQTPETYLGAGRQYQYAPGPLPTGAQTFREPDVIPDDEFGLSGGWTVGQENLTSGQDAGLQLNFHASTVYLDVGGTGTITATVNGQKTTYKVSGAPNIYAVFHAKSEQHETLQLALSPGLSTYSFTFG